MRSEPGVILKFRHGIPEAFGHIGHAAAGIFPFLDGHGIIKAFPEEAVGGFCLVGFCHFEVLQRCNHGFSLGVQQDFSVCAVINKERFVIVPGAEMPPQKGEYSVFRFDLAAQNAAEIGETHEAFQQMCFAVHGVDRFDDGVYIGICHAAEEVRTLLEELADQSVEMHLLLRQTSEKPASK